MKVTQQEILDFRKDLNPDYKLSDCQIINMILADKQRDEIRKANGSYYDYDRQCWIEPKAKKVI